MFELHYSVLIWELTSARKFAFIPALSLDENLYYHKYLCNLISTLCFLILFLFLFLSLFSDF